MKKRPNIVFILSDDQCPHSLGLLHTSELQTPNLDALAADGTRFENFFCASPVCSPARASILTGTMPSYHGVHDWIRAGNLDPEQYPLTHAQKEHYDYLIEHKAIDYLAGLPTYTQALADSGYTCALSGKWHLGDSARPQCGFTHWYTIGKGGCDNYMDPDIVENGTITFPKQYLTDLITDKAVEFVGELAQGENPFYLSVHYIAPHTPWEDYSHKEEHLALYRDCDYDRYFPRQEDHPHAGVSSRRYNSEAVRKWSFIGYEAATTAMDEGIGRVLDALKAAGVYENTIVVFTSDNGFNLGHHGLVGKGNASFPTNVYEEAIKVPFLACGAGIAAGKVSKRCHSHYDLFPTLLELAGVAYTPEAKQPGKSFAAELQGDIPAPDETAAEDVYIYDEYGATRMLRTARYKYVHRFPTGPHALYDLQADAGETNNLHGQAEYRDLELSLRKQLYAWFNAYTKAETDGTKELVTGSGQLCRVGAQAEQYDTFYRE